MEIDAKNQRVGYIYNQYNRLTELKKYRVAGGATPTVANGCAAAGKIFEEFEYNGRGLVMTQGLRMRRVLTSGATYDQYTQATYTYDAEGKRLSANYPSAGEPGLSSTGLPGRSGESIMGRIM